MSFGSVFPFGCCRAGSTIALPVEWSEYTEKVDSIISEEDNSHEENDSTYHILFVHVPSRRLHDNRKDEYTDVFMGGTSQ